MATADSGNGTNKKTKAGFKAGLKIAKLGGKAGLGVAKLGLTLGGVPGGAEICDTIGEVIEVAEKINEDTNIVDSLVDAGVDKAVEANDARNEGKEPKPVKAKEVLSQEELEKQERNKKNVKRGLKVAKFGAKLGLGALKVGLAAAGESSDAIDGISEVIDLSEGLADGLEQATEITDQVVEIGENLTEIGDTLSEKIESNEDSSVKEHSTPIQAESGNGKNKKTKAGFKAGLKIAKLGGKAGLGVVKLGLTLGGVPGGAEICDTIGEVIEVAEKINEDTNIVDNLVDAGVDKVEGSCSGTSTVSPKVDKSYQSIHQGFLTKQGGSIKTWKKRFFTLRTNNILYYYRDINKDPRGKVDLKEEGVKVRHGIAEEDTCYQGRVPFNRTIVVDTVGRKYYLYSETVEEADKWLEVLNVAVMPPLEQKKSFTLPDSLVDAGVDKAVEANDARNEGKEPKPVKAKEVLPQEELEKQERNKKNAKRGLKVAKFGAKLGLGALKVGLAAAGESSEAIDGISEVIDLSEGLADGLEQATEITDQVVEIGENLTEIGDTLLEKTESNEDSSIQEQKMRSVAQPQRPMLVSQPSDPTEALENTKKQKPNQKKNLAGISGRGAGKLGLGVMDAVKNNVDIEIETEGLDGIMEATERDL